MELDNPGSGSSDAAMELLRSFDRVLRQLSACIITEAEGSARVADHIIRWEPWRSTGPESGAVRAETLDALTTGIVDRFWPRYAELVGKALDTLAQMVADPIRDASARAARSAVQADLHSGDRNAAVRALIASLESPWMCSRIQDMEAVASIALQHELPEVLIAGWPRAKGGYRVEEAWVNALGILGMDTPS